MALEPISYRGRPRILDLAYSIVLLNFLDERPIAYLDKIRFFLYNAFDLLINKSTISRKLKYLDFS